jgi:hypothetical protein
MNPHHDLDGEFMAKIFVWTLVVIVAIGILAMGGCWYMMQFHG